MTKKEQITVCFSKKKKWSLELETAYGYVSLTLIQVSWKSRNTSKCQEKNTCKILEMLIENILTPFLFRDLSSDTLTCWKPLLCFFPWYWWAILLQTAPSHSAMCPTYAPQARQQKGKTWHSTLMLYTVWRMPATWLPKLGLHLCSSHSFSASVVRWTKQTHKKKKL